MRLSNEYAATLGIDFAICSRCGNYHAWRLIDGRPPCPGCGKVIGEAVTKPEEKEKAPRKSKYGNVRTTYGGVAYDSKAEARFAEELDRRKAAGEIYGWARQVRFFLPDVATQYVADFLVIGSDGAVHVVDVKGMPTAKFRADVRRWRLHGPCKLLIVYSKGKTEIITPERIIS